MCLQLSYWRPMYTHECCVITAHSVKPFDSKLILFSCRKKYEFPIMAEENKEMDVDGEEMMEEGDEDWEYYDDNDVLTDFWQVGIAFAQLIIIALWFIPSFSGLYHE